MSPSASRGRERSLVGDWRLRSWTAESDDGHIELPFGESPDGILVYTEGGTMITTIARPDRGRVSWVDPLHGGPDAERAETARTFVAYSGRFDYDGTDVTHTVEMSLYPNWVGTRQVRHVRLSDDGGTLELSTDPFTLGGRRSVQRLVWVRADRDGGRGSGSGQLDGTSGGAPIDAAGGDDGGGPSLRSSA